LNVTLQREIGWATVRDRLFYGELDAAQSIAGIAFALGFGFTDLRCEVSVPLILNLPPSLMPRHLKAGHIDGYCVGEPYNSEAILGGFGWAPVTSADLSYGHPEKVLLVSGNFMNEGKNDTINLVSALIESCKLCEDPAFREDLIGILGMSRFTAASPEILRNSLGDFFNTGTKTVSRRGFHMFSGDSVNRPTTDKAS